MVRWILIATIAVSGCGFGQGTGALDGSLFIRGCTQDNDLGSLAAPATYAMNPQYFVGLPIDAPPNLYALHPVNALDIRMQSLPLRPEDADTLYVTIEDESLVASAMNTQLTLGPTTNVRAVLVLSQSCPYAEAQVELDGNISFSAFGSAGSGSTNGFSIGFGDRVAAKLTTTVVDRRAIALGGTGAVSSTPAVAGQLTGSFDFIVQPGKAAQPSF